MNEQQQAFFREYLELCLKHNQRVSAVLGRRFLRDLGGYLDVVTPAIEPLDSETRAEMERELAAFGVQP